MMIREWEEEETHSDASRDACDEVGRHVVVGIFLGGCCVYVFVLSL